MQITVSAVVFVRDGFVFTVRKLGTSRFMNVGGKPEHGESPEQCARRETIEEIGVELAELEYLGRMESAAANEPGHHLVSHVFLAVGDQLPREVTLRAEIEESRWIAITAQPADDLAPLLTTRVLPLLRQRQHQRQPAEGARGRVGQHDRRSPD